MPCGCCGSGSHISKPPFSIRSFRFLLPILPRNQKDRRFPGPAFKASGFTLIGVIGVAAVLAMVCDGTGYGMDGSIWGGELLVADLLSFRRVARGASGAARVTFYARTIRW